MAGVGRDVRVDGRLAPLAQPTIPSLVVAARLERVAGEVEVVLEQAGEVLRARADLDEVDGVPGAPQCHGRLVEQQVDVDRLEGLAVAALLHLLDEPDDRRVLLRERGLVGEIGAGRGAEDERGDDRRDPSSSDAIGHRRCSTLGLRRAYEGGNRRAVGAQERK